VYTNNNADANIFGLEPNFGCCTANFHQGWPKFCSHLWMRASDGGLAAVAYAPCIAQAEIEGQVVRITVETDYPFDETVRMVIETDVPVRFPLQLRIPNWAEGTTITVADALSEPADPGTFARVERMWDARTELVLHMPMRIAVQRRYNGSVAVSRGPLVCALRVGEEWRPILPVNRSAPTTDPRVAYDYEVYPTSEWNVALVLDPDHPEQSLRLVRRTPGEVPFSPEDAPVELHGLARLVRNWGIAHGAAQPPPIQPEVAADGPHPVVLIPYGCTNLRVTEIPVAFE
jgi:hypothetical protein